MTVMQRKAGLAQRQDEPVLLIRGGYIYGTAHQATEASKAGAADQARPAARPAQASIALV